MWQLKLTRAECWGYAVLIVAAVVGSVIEARDLVAWLLVLLSFPLLLLQSAIRDDTNTRMAAWTVLVGHHLVAFVFAFGEVELSLDAEIFHRDALRYAASGKMFWAIDFDFYTQVMARLYRWAGFYRLGGGSRLLAAQISVAGFVLAMMIFAKLYEKSGSPETRPLAILLFGCLPSVLIFTSIPLRESFELALFILYVYMLFSILNKPRTWLILLTFLVALVFGLFHKGLILYSIFMVLLISVVCLYFYAQQKCGKIPLLVSILLPLAMFGVVLMVSHLDMQNSGLVNRLLAGDFLKALEESRGLIMRENPRSAFSTAVDFSSFSGFVGSYVQVFWQYLAGPFVWNAENLRDLAAAGEGMVRMILLVGLILTVVKKIGDPQTTIILLLYLTMTMLWALGTTNYGQAIRHHVLTNWMLILLGLPALYEFVTQRGWLRPSSP